MHTKPLNPIVSLLMSVLLACALVPAAALADEAPDGTEGGSNWMDQAAYLDGLGVLNRFPNSVPDAEGEGGHNGATVMAESWRYSQGYPKDTLEAAHKNQGITTLGAWSDLQMGDLDIPDTWTKADGVGKYTVRATPTVKGRQVIVPGALAVGIDVSVHNNMPPARPAGSIDWAKVKADGISFVIIRCGYGSNYANQDDAWFADNYKGAKAAGLAVGVYLYSYAPKATGAAPSAASEADHVLRIFRENNIQPSDLAFPVYLDLEDASQQKLPKGTLGAIAQTFCDRMKAAGYQTGIYASQYWFNEVLKNDSPVFAPATMKQNGWSRWVARYSNGDTKPGVESTDIWQFTCIGAVAGIPKKYCDVNFSFVNFNAPTVPAPAQPDVPPVVAPDPEPAVPASFAVNYQLNGGKNHKANAARVTESLTLSDPTRKGYTFGGWFSDAKLKQRVHTVTVAHAPEGSVTLHAKWYKNYKITYKLNGGKNNAANPKKYGGPLVLKDPTRKGYAFKGWYTNKKLTKKLTKLTVTKNRTVYAKWVKGTYYKVKAADGLNIRKSPSLTAETNGALAYGKKVLIVKKSKGWGRLSGKRGWIKLEFAEKA